MALPTRGRSVPHLPGQERDRDEGARRAGDAKRPDGHAEHLERAGDDQGEERAAVGGHPVNRPRRARHHLLGAQAEPGLVAVKARADVEVRAEQQREAGEDHRDSDDLQRAHGWAPPQGQFGGRMIWPGVSGARISAGGGGGDESILGYIAEFVRPSCRLP